MYLSVFVCSMDATLDLPSVYGPSHDQLRTRTRHCPLQQLASTCDYTLPTHLAWRLTALVGDSKVGYAEASVSRYPDLTLSGRAVVLTERRVLLAEITGAQDDQRDSYTVQVHSWSRAELVRVSVLADEASGVNGDRLWREDWGSKWPPAAAVTLEYRNGEQLQLPMQPESQATREAFAAVLPSLLADLEH
jgi:hypothetical protein